MTSQASTAPEGAIEIIDGAEYLFRVAEEINAANYSVIGAHYMMRGRRNDDAEIYRHFWTALHTAAARVGQTRLLLNSHFPRSHQQQFNHRAAGDLAAAGWKIRHQPPAITAHEKLWIIDGHTVILGSSNIGHDQHHRTTNINILFRSHQQAQRIMIDYNRKWAASSDKAPE